MACDSQASPLGQSGGIGRRRRLKISRRSPGVWVRPPPLALIPSLRSVLVPEERLGLLDRRPAASVVESDSRVLASFGLSARGAARSSRPSACGLGRRERPPVSSLRSVLVPEARLGLLDRRPAASVVESDSRVLASLGLSAGGAARSSRPSALLRLGLRERPPVSSLRS